MLAEVASRAGDWGVADAGAGPRLIRDEPWLDWRTVTPQAAPALPIEVGMWPGTGICDGLQDLLDRPVVVALTVPFQTDPTARLTGWWTNGTTVSDIDTSVQDVTPSANAGYRALVRTDQTPWPTGRYELHLVTGTTHQAVAFCIHRSS